jgi:CO/xanthine dehydrogenase Mo-binding subunit
MKNVGFSFGYPEESTAVIILYGDTEIEAVDLLFAGAECGQGIETVVRQMAAEDLSLAIEKIRLVGADTSRSPEAGSASASRLTMLGGNAIRGAAQLALAAWINEDRPAKGVYTYHAPPTNNFDPQTGYTKPHVVFSPVAQGVNVSVDGNTGEVRVLRVVSVIDSGQPVNPNLLSGQVEGAVVQALGYTLMENFVTEQGCIKTPDLTTYLIPTVLDIPAVNVVSHCVHPEAIGPWGARGIGETAVIAIAPAVAAGLHDATGVWFDRLPLTPQEVFSKVHSQQL